MAKSRKTTERKQQEALPVLQYFGATQAGDWWTVHLGHTLEAVSLPRWCVTGWSRAENVVYIACGPVVAEKAPEQLHMRWKAEETRGAITYRPNSRNPLRTDVLREGKFVGRIVEARLGKYFRYYTGNGPDGGEAFDTLEACKRSLEGEG